MSMLKLFDSLLSNQVQVQCGVFISDQTGRLLLQRNRKGSWELLGGYRKKGESLEQTASREVITKTGLIPASLQWIELIAQPTPNDLDSPLLFAIFHGEVDSQQALRLTEEVAFFDSSNLPIWIDANHEKIIQTFFSRNDSMKWLPTEAS